MCSNKAIEIIDNSLENKFRGVGTISVEHLEYIKEYIENQLEYINKLENKLMYALSPTTHELAITTQEHFKAIIRDNLENDTYTIRGALKEYWKTF